MKKSFLFISCEEAHHICDKSQYGEASLWERIKLSIRLSWCTVTRAYTKRNKALTRAMKSSNVDFLKDDELDTLRSQFNQELKNQ
ncbi:hypothetical protein [Psychroserpens sp.]|uniref:hypothetical protein n=1 Tax=Psychroserpens sp. TaxID=2020870 RepID=UPI002AA5F1C8|nr:hypothetical protein [Psychroserpens sp.]